MSILVNGKKISFTRFPNNETNCSGSLIESLLNLKEPEANCIEMRFEGNEDLIHLMFVKSYLNESNIDAILKVDYFPYSRFDRDMNNSLFTLKYVANFINSLNFKKVMIVDAHSDVTPALLNKCINRNYTRELYSHICRFEGIKDLIIFFPDQGAYKKYSKMFEGVKTAFGAKERNLATGEIVKYNIVGENIIDKDVVIVDDLCSRGGTFELASKFLKEMGARNIYLIVSHCEVNIFNGSLLKKDSDINAVYTTDSIITDNYHGEIFENLTVVSFKDWYK